MPEDGYPLGRGFLPAARYDADTNQRTVINLAGTFVPATDFDNPPTWSAGSGPFADFQFAQLPLSRLGADESDTLEQGLSILAVSLTDGG